MKQYGGRYTRLIACDLDDTLLDSSSRITESTRAILSSALADGTTALTVSTGRQLLSLHAYIRQLEITAVPIIAETGAVLFDPVTYAVVREWLLPEVVIRSVMGVLEERVWGCTVYLVRAEHIEALVRPGEPMTADHEFEGVMKLQQAFPLQEWPAIMKRDRWRKICILGPAPRMRELDGTMRARLGGTAQVERPSEECMDILAAGVNKGSALAALMDLLDLPAGQVMAVGDSPADISMLDVAGVPVAVRNACPEVKERARFIVPSNDEDGAALAVAEFVCGRYHAVLQAPCDGEMKGRSF